MTERIEKELTQQQLPFEEENKKQDNKKTKIEPKPLITTPAIPSKDIDPNRIEEICNREGQPYWW